jgi:pyruvate,water dikinase
VLTSASPESEINRFAGGKGRNLFALTRAGIKVPPWAVVGADVCQEFLQNQGITDSLRKLLDEARIDNLADVSANARQLIASGSVTADLAAVIRTAYDQVGGAEVAVRSSGLAEDGQTLSFAGQFSTYLNVSGFESVLEHVRECWASAYSERSLHYRLSNGQPLDVAALAVVVQQFIPAEKSGVIFSANPVGDRRDEYLISSVYGLGEGLVSGAVDADTLVVSRDTGAVLDTIVGDKRDRYDAAERGRGLLAGTVPEQARKETSIDPEQVAQLWRTTGQIVEIFGTPQDIEWSFAAGTLWILQSRPITTLRETPPADGELHIWDNANIVESFSGVVSPLTYSFAKDVYARVYRKYAETLKVPREQLAQMEAWLPAMLGYINGRVYYNLLHWYRMVRLAPIYRMNRKVLERTIGVEESLDDSLAESIYPFEFRSPARARLYRIRTTVEFARRFLTLPYSVNRFLVYFYATYEKFEQDELRDMAAPDAFRKLQRLQRELIDKWGPMMVLDAAILTSLGSLHLLTARWLPDAPDWFKWAVASPGEDVESAGPAHRLNELAALVRADEGLSALVRETPVAEAYTTLAAAGYGDFLAEVDAYISLYGYRSLDELKLEVPDLREEPAGFFAMLQSALPEQKETVPGHGAVDYLNANLGGPKRLVYEILRRKLRRSLRDRERVRFARTRAFGMAKRLVRAIGRDLAGIGAIDDWQDVFYLRMEELRGCFDGTIAHSEIKPLIAIRKKAQEANRAGRAPSRFQTKGAVYWQGNLDGWSAGADGDGRTELVGTGSCPGTAEGVARVVESPVDAHGDILVTYRTDPGWVPVLPTAAALLIERGSPVTHVAIVARELGVPTVVQIPGLTTNVRTGMRLAVDGGSGRIRVLAEEQAPAHVGDAES